MTDEHVIPDSLGGYYHIYNVCKSCNSKLGDTVDSKLVNHHFSEFMRYINGIKGKSSSIPNPFSGTHYLKNNPTKKVQLRINEEGKPKPYLIPEVNYNKNERGVVESFSISVDASDKNKLQGMLNKITKRLGVPPIEIDVNNLSVTTTENPTVSSRVSIDIKDFRIGLLKIAYEFAVDSLPEYYLDDQAVLISNALHVGSLESLDRNYFIGTGLEHEIKESLSFLLDFSSKKHYLLLINLKDHGLVCMIYLYDTFSIGIKLSSSSNLLKGNWLLGVNDIEKKKFTKLMAEDAINYAYSEPRIRFQYHFNTQSEVMAFHALEKRYDFAFYKENDSIPVYNKVGNIVCSNISKKMKSLESMAFGVGDPKKELTNEVQFQEELFIKLLPVNQLFRVTAAREERYLERKI